MLELPAIGQHRSRGVGQANLHLDLWSPNFGIQEWCRFDELTYEMFPGLPQVRNGYMYPSDKPGLGIEIDTEAARQYLRDEDRAFFD